jgi:hypothetical protein
MIEMPFLKAKSSEPSIYHFKNFFGTKEVGVKKI